MENEVLEETKQEVVEEQPKEETTNEKKPNKVLDFFIKTLNGMAYGLFATLIIGTIFSAIGILFSKGAGNKFCEFMANILNGNGGPGLASMLQCLTGAGIGIGIALALKFNPLQTIILGAVGEGAAFFSLSTKFVTGSHNTFDLGKFQIGDPLTIYLVCIAVALAIKYVLRKKTPVDIILIPLFGITVGTIAALLIRYPAIYVTYGMQWLINEGTKAVPFVAGIVVAVLMGMALTAPISSAAIGAMVFAIPAGMSYQDMIANGNEGLLIASGAAIVGCCCQMVGFAVQSRKDNGVGMIISIGIGTSMLQFKNILKKPVIWLPTIIASAILGPIVACLGKYAGFSIVCMGANAGMGTAGLVGQIGTITSMMEMDSQVWKIILALFVFETIVPGVLVYGIDLLFRKLGLIKKGDLAV